MHARKDIAMCFYTTRITHLAKSTRLHYTMDVVLLTQLCMVVASPVQGIGSCNSLSLPHLLSRQFHFTSSRGFSQSPVSIKPIWTGPSIPNSGSYWVFLIPTSFFQPWQWMGDASPSRQDCFYDLHRVCNFTVLCSFLSSNAS